MASSGESSSSEGSCVEPLPLSDVSPDMNRRICICTCTNIMGDYDVCVCVCVCVWCVGVPCGVGYKKFKKLIFSLPYEKQ